MAEHDELIAELELRHRAIVRHLPDDSKGEQTLSSRAATALTEADTENARLRTKKRDWQVACGVAANQRDALQAKLDAVKAEAQVANRWVMDHGYYQQRAIVPLQASLNRTLHILNGEEPNNE